MEKALSIILCEPYKSRKHPSQWKVDLSIIYDECSSDRSEEVKVIDYHFNYDGFEEPLDLKTIGKMYRKSIERVLDTISFIFVQPGK